MLFPLAGGRRERSIIPLHPRVRDVGEGDALGRGVTASQHAAVAGHLAAVAGAQFVEGGIEAPVLIGVFAGSGFDRDVMPGTGPLRPGISLPLVEARSSHSLNLVAWPEFPFKTHPSGLGLCPTANDPDIA